MTARSQWAQGAGSETIPVLPHTFEPDDECCTSCHHFVPASEINNRCPARVGQDRGLVQ